MGRRRPFGAIAAWSVRHARAVLVVAGVLALAAAFAATQVDTDAGLSTLVGKGDPTYEATQRVRAEFGEEPVVVLVKGSLPKLLLGKDLLKLLRLEGCLSGKVPKGATPVPGACTELAAMEPVSFLAGPATFLNEAVVQIDEQLERLSKNLPADQFNEYLLQVASKYGITSLPSIENEEFIATVVFDLAKARGTPKARLAYLFPNSESAQIVIRLKPGITEAERRRAIGLIEDAVAETTPRKACGSEGKAEPCFVLQGGEYVVTGAPVLVDAIARALKDALLLLFGVAVAVMAIVLLLAFRSRLRLLPSGAGPRLRRDPLRPPRRRRRQPDDGVRGGPANPHRPGRRLRDPVPGEAGRGGSDRSLGRRRSKDRRQPLRPHHRHRVPRNRRRLPGAPALPDADGPRLRRPPLRRRPSGFRPGDDCRVRRPEHAPLGRVAP